MTQTLTSILSNVRSIVGSNPDKPYMMGIYMWCFQNGRIKVGKFEGFGRIKSQFTIAQDSILQGTWMVWSLGVPKHLIRMDSTETKKTWAYHVEDEIKRRLATLYATQEGSTEIFECGPDGPAKALAIVNDVTSQFEAASRAKPTRALGNISERYMDCDEESEGTCFSSCDDDGDSDYEPDESEYDEAEDDL